MSTPDPSISSEVRQLLEELHQLNFTNRTAVLVWIESFFKRWDIDPSASAVKTQAVVKIGQACEVLPDPNLDITPWRPMQRGSDEYAQWLLVHAINTFISSETAYDVPLMRRSYHMNFAFWRGEDWSVL